MSVKQGKFAKTPTKPKSRKRWLLLLVPIVLAAGILAVLLTRDPLQGRWNYGTTVYVFDGRGEGSMDLPDQSYPYTYQLSGERLTVDFTDDQLSDMTYLITLEGNVLTLRSGEDVYTTYELIKEEK